MTKPKDQRDSSGFLSIRVHPNIVAAFAIALCAGGWKLVTESLAADARHDQQAAQLELRITRLETEVRAIATRKTTRE